ncbi:Formate hydrogenlyase transcriptional activator [Olavius algarvensis associated proteobacterium Delta 3]|nr:Formate hydrogenlyase transcriptional activator [Olavius algarvensis associated proteobacterium Delta 3]
MSTEHNTTHLSNDILIVDDEIANLKLLAHFFVQHGYQVRPAEKPQLAIDSAISQPPALILLDVKMPEMDGFEVCRRLKQDERTRDVPIIFISALYEVEDKVRGFEAGGVDFISKPFQEQEVLARVRTHMDLRNMQLHLEELVAKRTAELENEINERKQAEKELAKSEAKYRSLVENSIVGVFTTTINGWFVFVNDAMARMYDFDSPEQMIAQGSLERWSDIKDRERMLAGLQKHGSMANFEAETITHTGRHIHVLFSLKQVGIHLVGMVMDITDRKQMEEGLRQSKEFNKSVLMSLPDHIAVLDRDGNILTVNDSWIKFARENDATSPNGVGPGVNYLEICRKAFYKGDETAMEALDGIHALLDGSSEYFEMEYPCDSPTDKRWFLMTVSPFRGRKGGVIVAHIDITPRKMAEIELRRAYDEIGQLKNQIEAESAYLQQEIKLEHNFEHIVGQSEALKYVLRRVEMVAPQDSTVLILGETGTGKELIARALHQLSPRNKRPLVKVNCAALPGELIESELFGREKGAFTGATTAQVGRFELADKSTLFLDEIGELPLELQAKLLRVLEGGEFERLGSPRTLHSNARIITATNRDLKEEVRKKNFREDLWYRLKIFPITIPPLRDRIEDIPLLADRFVQVFSKKMGKEAENLKITKSSMRALQSYPWPGNVRELQHVIESALITSDKNILKLDLPKTSDGATRILKTFEEMEREYILDVLKATNWKIKGKDSASAIIGLHPNTLHSRMKKLGLKRP